MKEYEIAILKEKGDIVNKALKLVNKLAKNKMADNDGFDGSGDNSEFINFIMEARTLKYNKLFEDLIN